MNSVIYERRDVALLKENILNLILQAEKEYHDALNKAMREGEKYVDDCKRKQDAFVEQLKRKWYLFEKTENENFQKKLLDEEQRMEAITTEKKDDLKNRQQLKADIISQRLKEEVLSLYGNS